LKGGGCPEVKEARDSVLALITQREAAMVESLRDSIDKPVTSLWKTTNKINSTIEAYSWITEGRGTYEYDDTRYRQETANAFKQLLFIVTEQQAELRKIDTVVCNPPQALAKIDAALAKIEEGK
jgi:hypothetical protein